MVAQKKDQKHSKTVQANQTYQGAEIESQAKTKTKIGGDKGQGPQILDVSELQDLLHDTKVKK